MDVRLFASVLWRFRLLMAVGLVIATLLATLSMARITFPLALEYRQSEVWTSQSRLFLTEPGFPWGRSIFPVEPVPRAEELDEPYVPQFADPGRFYSLAELYAQLANSDEVLATAKRRGLGDAAFFAAPVPTTSGSSSLPLLTVTGSASTPAEAVKAANLGITSFKDYLTAQQKQARIPPDQRVQVDVVSMARQAVLSEGRRLTLPVVVFLSVLMAFLGLALLLENLRPRQIIAEDAAPGHLHAPARRSA